LFHATTLPHFFQDYCNAHYTDCFPLVRSSRKLELLSRLILKDYNVSA
jgi:hypothetical protein